jgi:hypothetical protein
MAYANHTLAGGQQIAVTSTVRAHPLGQIVRATDPTYGQGEFIYLLGVASTTVGSIVSWNATTYQTALGVAVSLVARPMAVAMSANVAAQYGWYQVSGLAVCAKSSAVSFAAGAAVGVLSTATGLAAATASGNELQGALIAAVASAASGRTTVTVLVNRPHMQGRIT